MGKIVYLEKSMVTTPMVETSKGVVLTSLDSVYIVSVFGDML